MEKFNYIILGAGPSGLTFAQKLKEKREKSFLILEKENEPGGLCRSAQVDGSPMDIGGGHFLDNRKKNVLDFIFKFMPEGEWNKISRVSTIKVGDNEIDYPFEANIWQFPPKICIKYLVSIFKAGIKKKFQKCPDRFIEWIYWKLGNQISRDYMIPYNNKIWSTDLNNLGTYWLYKLPDVSLRNTLLSFVFQKPFGKIPGHAQFYYPKKFGYGEVWKRVASDIKGSIIYGFQVDSVNFDTLCINGKYQSKCIVNTIPWREITGDESVPDNIKENVRKLEYISLTTSYYNNPQDTKAHWTYFPDEKLSYHRKLFRFNFLPGSRGYWTETNQKRWKDDGATSFHHPYAYPLNTIDKPKAIKVILDWAEAKNVYGLGRWGRWNHMNSDVAVDEALALAEKVIP